MALNSDSFFTFESSSYLIAFLFNLCVYQYKTEEDTKNISYVV